MNTRNWARPLAAGILVIGLVACGGGSGGAGWAGSTAGGGAARGSSATIAAQPPVKVVPAPGDTSTTTVPAPIPVAPGSRVIRNGQVGIEVRPGRFDSTYSQLIALAGEEGGVVAASNATSDRDRIKSGTVTLSVPSDRFQATIDRLRQMGTVELLNVSSQDVSQQYVDLKARLANAQAERDAMLALLQRAQSIQDIITVQRQLGQYTQEVEQLKGQIDYLDHATSYSTIQVSIREAGAVASRGPADDWGLVNAFWTGLHAFVATLNGLVVVLITIGPYAVLALLGWLAWRRRRRMLGGGA